MNRDEQARELAVELVELWQKHLEKLNELRDKYPLMNIRSSQSLLDNALRIVGFPSSVHSPEQYRYKMHADLDGTCSLSRATAEEIYCNASSLELRESNLTWDSWGYDIIPRHHFDTAQEYVDWLYEQKKAYS